MPEAVLLLPCLCIQGPSLSWWAQPFGHFVPWQSIPDGEWDGACLGIMLAVKRSWISSWALQWHSAMTFCLTGFFVLHVQALGSWNNHFALGELRPTLHSSNSCRRIPAPEQSVAVLEMGLGSAQAQASLGACPELRRRLLLLQACMKVKITPKFTFILTLNSFRAMIALKWL